MVGKVLFLAVLRNRTIREVVGVRQQLTVITEAYSLEITQTDTVADLTHTKRSLENNEIVVIMLALRCSQHFSSLPDQHQFFSLCGSHYFYHSFLFFLTTCSLGYLDSCVPETLGCMYASSDVIPTLQKLNKLRFPNNLNAGENTFGEFIASRKSEF